jgi:hypothetical protein
MYNNLSCHDFDRLLTTVKTCPDDLPSWSVPDEFSPMSRALETKAGSVRMPLVIQRFEHLKAELDDTVASVMACRDDRFKYGFGVFFNSKSERAFVSEFVKRLYGALDNIDTIVETRSVEFVEYALDSSANGLSYDQRKCMKINNLEERGIIDVTMVWMGD